MLLVSLSGCQLAKLFQLGLLALPRSPSQFVAVFHGMALPWPRGTHLWFGTSQFSELEQQNAELPRPQHLCNNNNNISKTAKIITVMYATFAAVAYKKPERYWNPCPLRYRCSALIN